MRITKKSEYALRALIKIAINHDRGIGVTLIHDIAKQEKIPQKYLERILLDLKNAGILASKRGAGGGYSLGRSPESINLGEVISIIEGSLIPLNYLKTNTDIEFTEETSGGLQSIMLDVGDAISNILENISLRDMTKKTLDLIEKKQSVLNYVI
ncbi:MAG: Rrf2 family transcriptional regulator [Actinobacteria bacterium]|nr:Rrf2 family transcriptional regulator [Actinomycetota bacterium]